MIIDDFKLFTYFFIKKEREKREMRDFMIFLLKDRVIIF